MSARAQERKVSQLENDVAAIYGLVSTLEQGQRRHDARFEGIDGRLDGIDLRLDRIDGRLDRIDGRLDELAQGMATVIDLVSRRSADD